MTHRDIKRQSATAESATEPLFLQSLKAQVTTINRGGCAPVRCEVASMAYPDSKVFLEKGNEVMADRDGNDADLLLQPFDLIRELNRYRKNAWRR